ncbi:hypothetical protein WCE37_03705 [Luteimonas sp. MJ250]
MALFFVLACLLAWLAYFAEARERLWVSIMAGLRAVGGRLLRAGSSGLRGVTRTARGSPASAIADDIRRHRRLLLALLLVIALPPVLVLVLVLRREVILDGFEGIQRPVASVRIEELLYFPIQPRYWTTGSRSITAILTTNLSPARPTRSSLPGDR